MIKLHVIVKTLVIVQLVRGCFENYNFNWFII